MGVGGGWGGLIEKKLRNARGCPRIKGKGVRTLAKALSPCGDRAGDVAGDKVVRCLAPDVRLPSSYGWVVHAHHRVVAIDGAPLGFGI